MSHCTSTYGSTVTHRCILPVHHVDDHTCRHGYQWSERGSVRLSSAPRGSEGCDHA